MPDIFISYSSRDRAFIAPMVQYFENLGLDVWWDRHIDAGSAYARDIENALDAAKSVVVVWSRHSVKSDWVRAEANEGHTRGILVPVVIDDTRLPLLFRSLQGLPCRFGNESDFAQVASAIAKVTPTLRNKLAAPKQQMSAAKSQKHWSIAPFFGRYRLLENLEAALSESRRGAGQVVLLSGESGMGKSRTAQELAERAKQKGISVHAAWSEANMYAPAYWPIIRMLRTAIEELNPPLMREDLGRGGPVLASLLPELRELFPDIGDTPDYSADHLIFEIGQALSQLFRNWAERNPILLLFDDLQCADAQTLAVFLIIARELSRSSVMILGNLIEGDLNTDSEFRNALSELTRAPHFAQYDLEALPEEEVTRFFAENVDGPDELKKSVVEKSAGIPLYITEFARSINNDVDRGVIKDSKALTIPSNLKNLLLGRVRSLTPGCREFLNVAAVMGSTLSPEIVNHLINMSNEAGDLLISEASTSGVLDVGPSGRLRFTHTLLRDTLYDDLNASARIKWHRALGDYYIEQQTSSVGVGSHCETIAHHFQLCGMIDSALIYWEKAANIASGQSAYADTIVRLRQALQLLSDSALPPRELIEKEIRLRLSLGLSIVTLKGSGAREAVPEYERAMELCDAYPDSPSLFYALNAVWSYHAMHCSISAIPLVERQLNLASQLNSDTVSVLASNAEATTRFFQGDFNVAEQCLERASRLWNQKLQRHKTENKSTAGLRYTMLSPLYYSWCLVILGREEAGLELAQQTLSEASQMGTYCHVQALSYLACIYEITGEFQQLKAISKQIIELAQKHGYLSWLAVAHCTHGKAVAKLENPAAGLTEAWSGIETYESLGGVLCLSWRQCQLAEILRLNQKSEEAVAYLDAALAINRDRFEHFADAEIFRLKGECMLDLGLSEGLSWIQRAQKIAQETSAHIFDARATAALAMHASGPTATV
ncbi:TIR domain-containing protein [Luminiphilus sp.]|nr:TIR domain-containing protein [Luminiphilus sp.]MDB2353000.1 TIR domain-containing protein [Luminiphilus sp.]